MNQDQAQHWLWLLGASGSPTLPLTYCNDINMSLCNQSMDREYNFHVASRQAQLNSNSSWAATGTMPLQWKHHPFRRSTTGRKLAIPNYGLQLTSSHRSAAFRSYKSTIYTPTRYKRFSCCRHDARRLSHGQSSKQPRISQRHRKPGVFLPGRFKQLATTESTTIATSILSRNAGLNLPACMFRALLRRSCVLIGKQPATTSKRTVSSSTLVHLPAVQSRFLQTVDSRPTSFATQL